MSRSDPTTDEIVAALSAPAATDARSITRRRFLQAAGATAGVAMFPGVLADVAGAATPIGPNDGVLVLITMAGGNDGLNTVIPVSDGTYYRQRGALAIAADQALPLSATKALHPRLGGIKSRWDAGQVAILEGVGDPARDLSHFTSMARWMHAGSSGPTTTGWLGRYIDGLPGGDDPFHAVHIGSSVPLVLQGRQRRATALPASHTGAFGADRSQAWQARMVDCVSDLAARPTGRGPWADALAANGRMAVDIAGRVDGIYAQGQPTGVLAPRLALCARLINADLGIRVLSVLWGDFDSHAGQPAMHGARMAEFDEAIDAFYAVLAPRFAGRVLLLTASEFGRRVQANGSSGTDHGTASTLLAIGPGVRPGFHGQAPSLTSLDRHGNLVETVDHRTVFATVLDRWLGADATQVLGASYGSLDFLGRPSSEPPSSGGTLPPGIVAPPPPPAGPGALTHQVTRLYLAYFLRPPDSGGLAHWVGVRARGLPIDVVSEEFARSPEFVTRYGALGNRAFVELIYRNVLGRGADPGGLAHWTGLLDRGQSRGRIMVGFSDSAEFVQRSATVAPSPPGHAPITRLYLAYFGRPADGDGLRYWVGTGLSTAAISDAFAASDEFRRRYGSLSDPQFVQLVYLNVLGRSPDAGGLQHWQTALRAGMSRGRMMVGFSDSEEYIRRTETLPD
jgi:uncharacterized protein (DUF1501 family)